MKKKLTKIILSIVVAILIWNHLPYYYSNDKAVDYITNHAGSKSKCSCAGYVMRGMWRGGCPRMIRCGSVITFESRESRGKCTAAFGFLAFLLWQASPVVAERQAT